MPWREGAAGQSGRGTRVARGGLQTVACLRIDRKSETTSCDVSERSSTRVAAALERRQRTRALT